MEAIRDIIASISVLFDAVLDLFVDATSIGANSTCDINVTGVGMTECGEPLIDILARLLHAFTLLAAKIFAGFNAL